MITPDMASEMARIYWQHTANSCPLRWRYEWVEAVQTDLDIHDDTQDELVAWLHQASDDELNTLFGDLDELYGFTFCEAQDKFASHFAEICEIEAKGGAA